MKKFFSLISKKCLLCPIGLIKTIIYGNITRSRCLLYFVCFAEDFLGFDELQRLT